MKKDNVYKFRRVLAVLISARWMVLHFTGKQVNTSYSSEQMLIGLSQGLLPEVHNEPESLASTATIHCRQ
jgi:hypothetical protein